MVAMHRPVTNLAAEWIATIWKRPSMKQSGDARTAPASATARVPETSCEIRQLQYAVDFTRQLGQSFGASAVPLG